MVTNSNLCKEISNVPPILAIRTLITPLSAKWVEGLTGITKYTNRAEYCDYYYCYIDSDYYIYIDTCKGGSFRAEITTEVSLEEFTKQVTQGRLECLLNQ